MYIKVNLDLFFDEPRSKEPELRIDSALPFRVEAHIMDGRHVMPKCEAMGERGQSVGKKSKQKVQERPKTTAYDVVVSIVPAFYLAGIRSFAGPCMHTEGVVAPCIFTSRVLLGLGIAALLLALMRLMGADKATKRSFDLLLVIVGILIAFLPGNSLALCDAASMTCRAVMLPFSRVVGIALSVCAFVCELVADHEEPTGRKRRR